MESESDYFLTRNVSYLRARDPSILGYNRPQLAQVKTNLLPNYLEETECNKENEHISVHLRIKNVHEPQNLYKISGNTLICNVPETSHFMRNIREGDALTKLFTFSKIFAPEATQSDIFNEVVKKKILEFINGHNSTLLTYGVSGSGKTFTVIGTDASPGLVPRSLEYLFRTLPLLASYPRAKSSPSGNVRLLNEIDSKSERQKTKILLNNSSSLDRNHHVRTYTAMQQRLSSEPVAFLEDFPDGVLLSVWVSFAEIYNEQIYDLLQPDPPRGKQRPRLRLGCSNGNTYIKNLTELNVSSGLEAYQVLEYGLHNLNYASTSLNSRSSRSHSIFTIKLVQASQEDGGTCVSSFNFCDLAGSERTKKTMNVGDRLKESNNINNSLLVLGRCISGIRECQRKEENKLVPFRESKLTQLFQKALSGHEDIAMIVTISPKANMFDETQHVLNFSAIAKEISLDRKPQEVVPTKKPNRFSQLVESRATTVIGEIHQSKEELRNVIALLQEELEQQRNELEMNEEMNRQRIINGYERIIEDLNKDTGRKVKEAENCVRAAYEARLQNMRLRYDRLLQEESERNVVICVDSDDEEQQLLKDEIKKLKAEVGELERKCSRYKLEAQRKDNEIEKMKKEILELKETVDDGVKMYVKLQEEHNQLRIKYTEKEIELDYRNNEVDSLLKKKDSESEQDDEDDELPQNISTNQGRITANDYTLSTSSQERVADNWIFTSFLKAETDL